MQAAQISKFWCSFFSFLYFYLFFSFFQHHRDHFVIHFFLSKKFCLFVHWFAFMGTRTTRFDRGKLMASQNLQGGILSYIYSYIFIYICICQDRGFFIHVTQRTRAHDNIRCACTVYHGWISKSIKQSF